MHSLHFFALNINGQRVSVINTHSHFQLPLNFIEIHPLVVPSMAFRFTSEKIHLTYKTHVPMDDIKEMAKKFGDTKIFSRVHEDGDIDEDTPTPYEHTHAFIWWKKKLDVANAKAWDINGIHPNVKTSRSIKWAKHICTKYHLGHKVKAKGKKYYLAPVLLEQEGVDDWKFEEDMWKRVRDAPTLYDACMDGGLEIKSISDAKTVRTQGIKRGFAEIEEDCDPEKFIEYDGPEWNRKKQSLVIFGHSLTGKTNWAKSQFEKAWVVAAIDDLKMIPEGCDGLVFDDCDFYKLGMPAQKGLSDCRVGKTIHARHHNAYKPHLPAIFTTNKLERLFDFDGDTQAVGNRCLIWETGNRNLYTE